MRQNFDRGVNPLTGVRFLTLYVKILTRVKFLTATVKILTGGRQDFDASISGKSHSRRAAHPPPISRTPKNFVHFLDTKFFGCYSLKILKEK